MVSASGDECFFDDLTQWFQSVSKPWPWRQSRTPYGSWIAEVMSQQTSLSVVKPRWQALIKELPDVSSLAVCEDEVLRRLWAGLGYYARARNLRRGAVHIAFARRGVFPNTYSEWLDVAGCGPYTAAVLASLHGQERVPCVDGNVVRVVSRLLDLREQTHLRKGRRASVDFLQREIQKTRDPGAFNEAIMELGQSLCRKTKPACEQCPLCRQCAAWNHGTVEASPPPRPKRAKIETSVTLLALRRPSGEIALVQRTTGLLKGTVGLPILSPVLGDAALRCLEREKAVLDAQATGLRHSITHHDIRATVLLFSLPRTHLESLVRAAIPTDKIEWFDAKIVAQNVSSSLDRKALHLVLEPR